jgi:hypothetical protein
VLAGPGPEAIYKGEAMHANTVERSLVALAIVGAFVVGRSRAGNP